MAKTINGVTFNNLNRIGLGSPVDNIVKGGITTESDLQDHIENNIEYRNIQSVLIDWNSADWDSVPASATSTINTTSDLLKTIKYAANTNREIKVSNNTILSSSTNKALTLTGTQGITVTGSTASGTVTIKAAVQGITSTSGISVSSTNGIYTVGLDKQEPDVKRVEFHNFNYNNSNLESKYGEMINWPDAIRLEYYNRDQNNTYVSYITIDRAMGRVCSNTVQLNPKELANYTYIQYLAYKNNYAYAPNTVLPPTPKVYQIYATYLGPIGTPYIDPNTYQHPSDFYTVTKSPIWLNQYEYSTIIPYGESATISFETRSKFGGGLLIDSKLRLNKNYDSNYRIEWEDNDTGHKESKDEQNITYIHYLNIFNTNEGNSPQYINQEDLKVKIIYVHPSDSTLCGTSLYTSKNLMDYAEEWASPIKYPITLSPDNNANTKIRYWVSDACGVFSNPISKTTADQMATATPPTIIPSENIFGDGIMDGKAQYHDEIQSYRYSLLLKYNEVALVNDNNYISTNDWSYYTTYVGPGVGKLLSAGYGEDRNNITVNAGETLNLFAIYKYQIQYMGDYYNEYSKPKYVKKNIYTNTSVPTQLVYSSTNNCWTSITTDTSTIPDYYDNQEPYKTIIRDLPNSGRTGVWSTNPNITWDNITGGSSTYSDHYTLSGSGATGIIFEPNKEYYGDQGNLILYPIYQPGSETNSYTLTLDLNGAEDDNLNLAPLKPDDYQYVSNNETKKYQKLENEGIITLPSNKSYTKLNRRFGGWNTQPDGSGVTYAPGTSIPLHDDLTLYAKWDIFILYTCGIDVAKKSFTFTNENDNKEYSYEKGSLIYLPKLPDTYKTDEFYVHISLTPGKGTPNNFRDGGSLHDEIFDFGWGFDNQLFIASFNVFDGGANNMNNNFEVMSPLTIVNADYDEYYQAFINKYHFVGWVSDPNNSSEGHHWNDINGDQKFYVGNDYGTLDQVISNSPDAKVNNIRNGILRLYGVFGYYTKDSNGNNQLHYTV